MNKSQRIRVDVGITSSHYVKTRLEQDTKTLEILSLQIDQKDIYQNFNSDYGVLIGRVYANGEVGIPNAKVSIFIPISEEDQDNSDIVAAYPYEKPFDLNRDGKRYNLLPRVGRQDPNAGNSIKPKQPFGSLPIKEEFVTNETWLEVYDKYYKYSTITNDSGDYMLFGVPVGVQTVHMSVDITDIGKYSMSPTDMVTQLGYSENLFTETGDIKPQRNLDDLPNIETQEISVDVVPFWGDTTNFDIGITRQDFRIRAVLISNFVIFGSYFTQGIDSVNGDPDRASEFSGQGRDDGFYRLSNDYRNNVDFRTNRIGNMEVKLYSYLPNIDMDVVDEDIATSGTTIDPQTDIYRVDSNSYFSYVDNDNGQFILSVPCNRRKIVTDEFGNERIVADDNVNGVFTEFHGMALVEFEDLEMTKTYSRNWYRSVLGGNSPNNARLKFKIPQNYYSLRDEENPYDGEYPAPWAKTVDTQIEESNIWRKTYQTFKSGEFYTVSQFFATKYGDLVENPDRGSGSFINNLKDYGGTNIYDLIGAFKVSGSTNLTQSDVDNINTIFNDGTRFEYDFPYNATRVDDGSTNNYFGGQWINMTMYFPQINWTFWYSDGDRRDQNTADLFWKDYFKGLNGKNGEWFSVGNSALQSLVGGDIGSSFLLSAHGFRTGFANVSKQDAVNLIQINRKGLFQEDQYLSGVNLTGTYNYQTPNIPAGSGDNQPFAYEDYAYDENYVSRNNPYFFRGMYNADCLKLLFDFNYI